MLDFFVVARELTFATVALRMFLAVFCGGLIGMERTLSRHTAGFRTHILVCLGAALTTLTSQYLFLYMGYFTDMARLGAQVIAGIGFLGAGTIITSKQRVRGLTTAAGLWTSAIIGLAIGAGFYEGALLATLLVEIAVTVFLRLEKYVVAKTSNVHVFFQYKKATAIDEAIAYCEAHKINVTNLEITRPKEPRTMVVALISLRLPRGMVADQVLNALRGIDGAVVAERF